jgi:hypothetical protein
VEAVLAESDSIQGRLWSHAVALAQVDRSSEIYALFTESLNTVFDLQTSRVAVALQYRIPSPIWTMLGLLTVISMLAVGFQFGVSGRRTAASAAVLALPSPPWSCSSPTSIAGPPGRSRSTRRPC